MTVDATDVRLLLALADSPRASVLALAERLGISRNTVQARLASLDARGVLGPFERRIDPGALGYPLTAFVSVQVVQRALASVAAALDEVPEVVEVVGLSGEADLLCQVVARDADDLYCIAGALLATDGVQRTTTSQIGAVSPRCDPRRGAPAPQAAIMDGRGPGARSRCRTRTAAARRRCPRPDRRTR